ncbi:lipoprotein [Mycoplasma putrefaciens]|uniref:Lipoprotein n=1 Tax=Mycoplasma putrefaciens Mput9231 TaxID=1292033 RepID=M9WHV4_9MOLU|nr:lipoprotein [Mycoplasma putrefaciens]AGJ91050.1 Hypothetical protein, predicted lipoprotein [Mycoplasma putrefaciens Mput9231]
MKKLLSILGSVGMIASTGAVAVACKTEQPAKMTQISDLIKNTELGELADNNASTIIAKVLEENKDSVKDKLVAEDLELKGQAMAGQDKKMKATITVSEKGKKKNFAGEVEVMFTVKEAAPAKMTQISDLIKNTELDDLAKTDGETIIKAALAKNQNEELKKAKLVAEDLELKGQAMAGQDKKMKATITVSEKGKKKNFAGEVTVTFKLKQM